MAPYFGLRGRKLTGLIGLVSGLCFFIFGYDQGDFGGLLTIPSFRSRFSQLDTIANPGRHAAAVQGITNASWNAGCIISAVCTIWVGTVLGRKRTMFTGLAILIIGEIIQCSSYSLGQLIAGRVIAGFGNGFTTAAVPAYQAETTRAHRRGTHLMISGAFLAAGTAFAYWIDFAFAYVNPSSAAWRVPIAFQLVVAVPLLVFIPFLPESPRWLVLTGRADEALKVLTALNDADHNDTGVYKEFLAIKDSMIEAASGSFSDIFTQGESRHLHRTILACFIQGCQQLSGINLLMQYGAFILLTQFGYTGWVARLLAACIATEGTLASFIPIVGIDKFWGRRSLFVFGAAGMSAAMVVLTIMSWLRQTHPLNSSDMSAAQVTATVFVFVFVTFFVIGWQGMSWLYSVEIVPLKIRGPATALSTATNWLNNFWVVLITPVAFNTIGWQTFIIFAVLNAVIAPLVWLFCPECAYRSLEEMDVIFHAASLSTTPWTTVVRDSREAPLWFGRDGGRDFDYEDSEWHQRKVRFSDETTTGSSAGTRGGDSRGHEKHFSEDEKVGQGDDGVWYDSSSAEGGEHSTTPPLTRGDVPSAELPRDSNETPAGATRRAVGVKKLVVRESGRGR